MIQIRRFEELRPGDRLCARDAIPRWIGSISWYGGLFCLEGEEFIVTDVYPGAIRVVSPEGGIHFFTNRLQLRRIKFISHGRAPSEEVSKKAQGDRGYGTWPRYSGPYRLIPYAPPRRVSRSTIAKASNKARDTKLPRKEFAVNAKRAPHTAKRQSTKTKTNKS